MGQYLPEVRGVFKLIEAHKKDLEKEVARLKNSKSVEPTSKKSRGTEVK